MPRGIRGRRRARGPRLPFARRARAPNPATSCPCPHSPAGRWAASSEAGGRPSFQPWSASRAVAAVRRAGDFVSYAAAVVPPRPHPHRAGRGLVAPGHGTPRSPSAPAGLEARGRYRADGPGRARGIAPAHRFPRHLETHPAVVSRRLGRPVRSRSAHASRCRALQSRASACLPPVAGRSRPLREPARRFVTRPCRARFSRRRPSPGWPGAGPPSPMCWARSRITTSCP